MKKPVTMSAERDSVEKNHSGDRIIPRSRTFEVSQTGNQETIGKDHALNERVRPLKMKETKAGALVAKQNAPATTPPDNE